VTMDLIPFDNEEDFTVTSDSNISAYGIFIEGNCSRPFSQVPISLMTINSHLTLRAEPQSLLKGFSPALLNFAALCCILFMCVGIPGNLITIFALARCKKVSERNAQQTKQTLSTLTH
jgi:hypothetical protein